MFVIMDFITNPITKNWILAFVIGLLSVFPSILASVLAVKNNPSCEMYKTAKLEDKLLTMPLFYGVLSVLVFFLMNMFFPAQFRRYWVIGIIFGLIYPTLGWLARLPQDVYGVTNYYQFYASALALYIPFYGLLIAYVVASICQ